MKELIHKDLSNQIIAAAFEVGNILGAGFLEKVYENALIVELQLRGLNIENQKQYVVKYKGNDIAVYQPDLIVDEKVIVEIKSTEEIAAVHKAQVINYLKVTGLKLGIIINFGKTKVEFVRIVL